MAEICVCEALADNLFSNQSNSDALAKVAQQINSSPFFLEILIGEHCAEEGSTRLDSTRPPLSLDEIYDLWVQPECGCMVVIALGVSVRIVDSDSVDFYHTCVGCDSRMGRP